MYTYIPLAVGESGMNATHKINIIDTFFHIHHTLLLNPVTLAQIMITSPMKLRLALETDFSIFMMVKASLFGRLNMYC